MKRLYLKNIKNVLFKSEKCALPLYLQLEATTYCNLACKMCIRNHTIKNPRHLTFEKFKRIYDQSKPVKLTLSGQGEPLMNPDLVEMIKYAKSSGTSVMIPSNGTLLGKNNIAEQLVDAKLNVLKISIDAARPETYKEIRSQDAFEKIIQGIKQLKEFKTKKRSIYPDIRFDVVILEENVNEIPDIIQLAKELGISIVFFRALQAEGLGQGRSESLGRDMDFNVMLDSVKQGICLAKKLKIKTNLDEIIRDFEHYKSIYVSLDAKMQNQICLLPYLQAFVSVDGKLSPCCALCCNEGISVGNVFEQGFVDVWNGKIMQNIRSQFAKRENKFKICRDCVPRSISVLFKMTRMLPKF